jgi:RecJ-like exonuclease
MKIFLVLTAAAGLLCAADAKYGKPLTLKEPMTLAALMSKAGDYAGKTVQVKGKVTEVCQAMGCWLNLVNDEGQHIKFEAHDAGISFPKDVVGKTAIAEGKFTKTELTREQAVAEAKEHAKDSGKPFDESKVKPGVEYSIEGTGAVIVTK